MPQARVAVGDVFAVPLDGDLAAPGQVVAKYFKDGYFVAIYPGQIPVDDSAELVAAVKQADPVLLALTLDAKFDAGHWLVVGRAPVRDSTPLPAYIEAVGTPDCVDVVDYSGARRRRAVGREAATLSPREVVAPVRVEKAAQALHGFGSWQESFNRLKITASFRHWRLYFPDERVERHGRA